MLREDRDCPRFSRLKSVSNPCGILGIMQIKAVIKIGPRKAFGAKAKFRVDLGGLPGRLGKIRCIAATRAGGGCSEHNTLGRAPCKQVDELVLAICDEAFGA